MKKPQMLIGLLAALGTAIGVLVAVVGLPYGRLNYTAFAELYHNGTNTLGGSHLAIDCDTTLAGTQSSCTYLPVVQTIKVDVTLGNESGAAYLLAGFNFRIVNVNVPKLSHTVVAAANSGQIGNPDFNGDATGADPTDTIPPPDVVGSFVCSPPNPGNVSGTPLTTSESFISCANGVGDGPNIISGAPHAHLTLARVTYNTSAAVVSGDSFPLTFKSTAVYDDQLNEVGSCNPGINNPMPCFPATLNFLVPPTNTPAPPTSTPTAGPTSTPVPPTNTATAVPPTNTPAPPTATFTPIPPPAGSGLIKVPEPCLITYATGVVTSASPNCIANAGGPGFSAANLWICQPNLSTVTTTDDCLGPGEGNLIVFEYGVNIKSDYDNDNVPDASDGCICSAGPDGVLNTGDDITLVSPPNNELGLGAYEFQVEYDNFVIQSVNPCDIVFSAHSNDVNHANGADGALDPAGAGRGNVDEIDGLNNPYCTPDANAANNGTCTMSLILENVVKFGCVTIGQAQGPSGNFDVAALNLIPHPDLTNDIFPGNNNGVLTVLKDNGCETADRLGHPTLGDVNGGLNALCTDAAVTVRILEGDLNLDCVVGVTDAQMIATHYGGFFGSLLYSKWLDLEPATHDLDIDIKDLQKVFGRIGSTCQVPVPAQPPAGFPAPPGN